MNGSIEIKKLNISFKNPNGNVKAIKDINTTIKEKQVTSIIGESGSGKSVLAMGILNLLPKYAIVEEEIYIGGKDIKDIRKEKDFYGGYFGLIPQSPGESISSNLKVKEQFKDTIKATKYKDIAISLLEKFKFKESDRILESYPFELSGGMAQRMVSSISLSSKPIWLIADEPTKGLDEETLKYTYDHFIEIKKNITKSMLIITHDLNFAKIISDEIIVMYDGQIFEQGCDVLANPLHPYTEGFLESLPENGFKPMKGVAPGPYDVVKGCSFYDRCPYKMEKCNKSIPKLYEINHKKVKCFKYA